jgi:Ring finger domain
MEEDDVISRYPLEMAKTLLRGLEIGMVYSMLSVSHCASILMRHSSDDISADKLDLILYYLAFSRVALSIPRPFYWIRSRNQLQKVLRSSSPREMSRRILQFTSAFNKISLDKILYYYYYTWLTMTIGVTMLNRSQLSVSLWRHAWFNVGFFVFHKICCVIYFAYLIRQPLNRGISKEILNDVSKVTQFSNSERSESEECSVCCCGFQATDKVRILSCSHVYHVLCIDEWLMNYRNKCPLCLNEVDYKKTDEIQSPVD